MILVFKAMAPVGGGKSPQWGGDFILVGIFLGGQKTYLIWSPPGGGDFSVDQKKYFFYAKFSPAARF